MTSDEQRAIVPEKLSDELCRQIACRAGVWPGSDKPFVPPAFYEAIRKYHAAMIAATACDGEGLIAISRDDYAILRAQQAPQARADDSERLDWLMRNVSGAEFRRLGVTYSGNCRRHDIDVALAANPQQITGESETGVRATGARTPIAADRGNRRQVTPTDDESSTSQVAHPNPQIASEPKGDERVPTEE